MPLQAFPDWMESVDFHLEDKLQMVSDELPDGNWYDYYESGMTPVEAIKEYAEGAGLSPEWWD